MRAGTVRREGDVWTFVFEGRTTRLRGMRGLLYLAELLARPDRERHAGDLVGAAAARSTSAGETPAAAAAGDAGERLDARARAAYESRLRDVRDELEEAQRRNDLGRSERLRDEMELLAAELARAYGLGGRPRRAASTQERARLSVTRAIKYAIDKIAPHDPALAEHLRRAVRTGTYCCYSPSERERVHWTL